MPSGQLPNAHMHQVIRFTVNKRNRIMNRMLLLKRSELVLFPASLFPRARVPLTTRIIPFSMMRAIKRPRGIRAHE